MWVTLSLGLLLAEHTVLDGQDTVHAARKLQVVGRDQRCDPLAADDVHVEVIDLRTLWPYDWECIAESIKKTGVFPNTAQQMIDVGERTGALGSQLGRAAVYYEREVTQRIKRLTDLFEPLVIIFIGLVVGFVAVAQVSAMYSVFSQIK